MDLIRTTNRRNFLTLAGMGGTAAAMNYFPPQNVDASQNFVENLGPALLDIPGVRIVCGLARLLGPNYGGFLTVGDLPNERPVVRCSARALAISPPSPSKSPKNPRQATNSCQARGLSHAGKRTPLSAIPSVIRNRSG
jgi:hypothetical protein